MTTSQTNLYHLTIREASALLKSGQLSPVELTQSFLDRIEATDDRLHSFIIVLKEQALDDARLAEAEIRRGDYKGPLHGIPFALKDLYDTAGITTTSGSKVDIDRVPTEDATTTARLKAAGGILLGKLAMHEFALGGPDFTTPFPPARNPWNLAHITGGGLTNNLPRVLPDGTAAEIDPSTWTAQPIFNFLQQEGSITDAEMFRTFNMGIGMVVVCAGEATESLLSRFHDAGETGAVEIGQVTTGNGTVSYV